MATTTQTAATSSSSTPALDRAAAGALYGACIDDTRSPIGETVTGAGSGPVVAVIGDSITSQVRSVLTADPEHQWVVWSRCGATTGSAIAAGAAHAVMAAHPQVVVVALGTNDTGFPEPQPGAAAGFAERARLLLDLVAGVPCVVWVNTAQAGDDVLQAEMNSVNQAVRELPGVHVADWAAVAAAGPGVLTDRVHLSTVGVAGRVGLLQRAVSDCP